MARFHLEGSFSNLMSSFKKGYIVFIFVNVLSIGHLPFLLSWASCQIGDGFQKRNSSLSYLKFTSLKSPDSWGLCKDILHFFLTYWLSFVSEISFEFSLLTKPNDTRRIATWLWMCLHCILGHMFHPFLLLPKSMKTKCVVLWCVCDCTDNSENKQDCW